MGWDRKGDCENSRSRILDASNHNKGLGQVGLFLTGDGERFGPCWWRNGGWVFWNKY